VWERESVCACSTFCHCLSHVHMLCECVMSYVDESFRIWMCPMTHEWITTHMDEHVTYVWVMSQMNMSCHTLTINTICHIWISHVTFEWGHVTYKWIKLHTHELTCRAYHWSSTHYLAHTNGSYHIWMRSSHRLTNSLAKRCADHHRYASHVKLVMAQIHLLRARTHLRGVPLPINIIRHIHISHVIYKWDMSLSYSKTH